MGSVSRDIYRSNRENDVQYAYNEDGLAALLKDIYRIEERKWFKGDIDATTILVDLKLALDSDCLTPRMRQVVALYYFVQLTEEESAKILGITKQTLSEALEASAKRVKDEIENGGANRKGRFTSVYKEKSPLFTWLNDIAYNGSPVYDVPTDVVEDALKIQNDELALEALRQQKYGKLVYIENYGESEEYPCLTEEQFKWRDRRMSFHSEIYPENEIVGYRKVAIKMRDEDRDNDGSGWRIEKRKLFKNNFN